jgi:hypothetical protein
LNWLQVLAEGHDASPGRTRQFANDVRSLWTTRLATGCHVATANINNAMGLIVLNAGHVGLLIAKKGHLNLFGRLYI